MAKSSRIPSTASPHFSPGFYCGGGSRHVYCVALGRAPRRTVDYACGALGRAPCIHARLRRLATKLREKCGQACRRSVVVMGQRGSPRPGITPGPSLSSGRLRFPTQVSMERAIRGATPIPINLRAPDESLPYLSVGQPRPVHSADHQLPCVQGQAAKARPSLSVNSTSKASGASSSTTVPTCPRRSLRSGRSSVKATTSRRLIPVFIFVFCP